MTVPRKSEVFILGGLTLRKKLGIDVMRQLNATMVADYRAANSLRTPSAMPVPNLEKIRSKIAGTSVFCTLDLSQGYW